MKPKHFYATKLMVCFVLFSASINSCLSQKKSDVDIEQLSEQFELSHHSLHSGAGSFKLVVEHTNPPVIKGISRNVAVKNKVMYYEFTFNNNDIYWASFRDKEKRKPVHICAYKDSVAKIISYDEDGSGLSAQHGYISDNTDRIMMGNPFNYTYYLFKYELKKLDLKMYEYKIKDIVYNGENCALITFKGSGYVPKFDGVDPRLYESQAHEKTVMNVIISNVHYKPLKYESSFDGVLLEEITIDYQNIDDHVFPEKIVHLNFSMQGEKISESEMLFSNDWKLNQELPRESFDIDFPSGLMILDERIGKSYIKE